MKLKPLFIALTFLGVTCMGSAQGAQSLLDKEGICDLLRKQLNTFERPENIPIDVLFFDINHDGIPDALLSYREEQRGGGSRGNLWALFQFKNGEWERNPLKETDDDNWSSYNSVFARGDDFYSLTMDGQKPKLVLVFSSSLNEGYGWLHDNTACEITIDSEGYLKTIPIPELTNESLVPHEGNELPPFDVLPPHLQSLVTNIPSQASIEMRKLLVPLSREVFYLPKPEDGKSPTVATAGQEGRAQASPPSRANVAAASLPSAEDETQRLEAVATIDTPPNRLWLYLAILPIILATGFYFLRRKFARN